MGQAVAAPRRRGFTLVEMTLATGLMALLGLLLATAFAVFGRPTLDVLARARVLRESRLALAALQADLGGGLALPPGSRGGAKEDGRLIDVMIAGGGRQLWLKYRGGDDEDADLWGAPNHIVVYQLQGRSLTRTDQDSGAVAVVAGDLDDFTATAQGPDLVALRLAFRFRDVTRIESFLWHRPLAP